MADETDIPVTTTETSEAPADAAPAAVVEDGAMEATVLGGEAAEAAVEGAPEAYALTAPEGFTLDAESLAVAEPIFKELNLSNDQAQKLMPVAAEFAKRIQTAGQQQVLSQVVAQRKAWAAEAEADSEIGGANWTASQGTAAKALDTLGFEKGSAFRNLLDESGLGNHPDMIRAFVRVGKAISEDSDFVRGDGGAQIKRSREEVLYPDDVKKEGA